MSVKNDYSQYELIPEDPDERLEWVKKELKWTDKDEKKYLELLKSIRLKKKKRKVITLTFYIVPEGISRPRTGAWGNFYVPNIKKFYDEMNKYMKAHEEIIDGMMCSEYKMDLRYYRPITSDMPKIIKMAMEKSILKNFKKPDWDNLGKGSDMFKRIVLDDCLATDVRVRKYCSFKPRIVVTFFYYTEHLTSYHEKVIGKWLSKK